MTKLTVVIPCYNEELNIPLILNHFASAINRSDVQLLLVDNGSTDGSAAVLAETVPKFSFARTHRVPVNQGYGYGILEGLAAVESEFMGWTHADMQTDPADILKGFALLEQGGDGRNVYIKGLRHGRSIGQNVFTCGMSVFETCLLGVPLWDINAQPNLFHRSFYEGWKDPPHDFSLDLYALYQAHKRGMMIKRFDVKFPPRQHGESKWNTSAAARMKFIKRTVDFSFQLKKRLG